MQKYDVATRLKIDPPKEKPKEEKKPATYGQEKPKEEKPKEEKPKEEKQNYGKEAEKV